MKALHLWIMLIAAAFVALAFSVVAQNPVRTLAPTALLSSAVYAVDVAAARAGYGTVGSAAAAAVVAGAVGVFYARWMRAPATAFATCAILPMLPGIQLYQGLLDSARNPGPLVTAAAALALAGSVVFGEYVATVVRRSLRLSENGSYAPCSQTPPVCPVVDDLSQETDFP